MSTTKRINQKKVDQIGYQRGRWAIYLFLAIVVVCQLLPFYLAINASMKPQTDMSSTLMPRLHDTDIPCRFRRSTDSLERYSSGLSSV